MLKRLLLTAFLAAGLGSGCVLDDEAASELDAELEEAGSLAIPLGLGFCGDGTVDPDEECDDGNNEDGDGCSAYCDDEELPPPPPPPPPPPGPRCANGILEPGEECDDNNARDGDGCSATCQIEEPPPPPDDEDCPDK